MLSSSGSGGGSVAELEPWGFARVDRTVCSDASRLFNEAAFIEFMVSPSHPASQKPGRTTWSVFASLLRPRMLAWAPQASLASMPRKTLPGKWIHHKDTLGVHEQRQLRGSPGSGGLTHLAADGGTPFARGCALGVLGAVLDQAAHLQDRLCQPKPSYSDHERGHTFCFLHDRHLGARKPSAIRQKIAGRWREGDARPALPAPPSALLALGLRRARCTLNQHRRTRCTAAAAAAAARGAGRGMRRGT